MKVEKKRIITLLRNLANELEANKTPVSVAIAWSLQQEDRSTGSGHFITHQSTNVGQRTLLRGELTRLLPLDDDMNKELLNTSGESSLLN